MKNLSKSKYTTYCQCPKALWLRIYKPEEQVIDPSIQARFEAGSEVGELAKHLFGESEDVTTYATMAEGSEWLYLKAMIAKTQDCLSRNVENIAEYALESGDFDVTAIDTRFTDKVPSDTQMGKVYARFVDSVTPSGGNFADSIISVYASPICETIDNYNSSAYYEPSYIQTRAYLNGAF